MPAITQTVPNFLGGVSRQTDDKKLINQVTDCTNGYPDPTFGLLKRPGMRHINVLKKEDGTAFNASELEGAAWFYIDRDNAGSYVGCIKGREIYVWTKDKGIFCEVVNQGKPYLTGTKQQDYHFRSVQDVTVITNKTRKTSMKLAPEPVANSVATLKLNELSSGKKYSVTIQGVTKEVTSTTTTTFDEMLFRDKDDETAQTEEARKGDVGEHLIDAIRDLIIDQQTANEEFEGIWSLESYTDSIVIKRFALGDKETSAVKTDYSDLSGRDPLGFTIKAHGGVGNIGLEAFQDSVSKSSDLPAESFTGHHVQIRNTNSADDDYYLEFFAFNTDPDTGKGRGKGYWRETVARDTSPGLKGTTMPYQLERDSEFKFTFKAINWVGKLVGDDKSNPKPSFIGKPITSTFFYNNRFGMLSDDNIILSAANDPFNFFVKSALTQVDSDPVDLNVASVQPVTLTDVLPSPQGLLLFSARQQFQMLSASATKITPNTTIIRSIANYEMDPNITPVDVGTTAAFLTKVPGYSKLFTLQLRDLEQSPMVVDISKVVLEWLPDSIDSLSVSPQNSVIMLTDRGSEYLYLYRFYNNGEKDLFQAWVKWELPSAIQSAQIIDDDVVIVSQHEDEYTLSSITLDAIPTGNVTTNGNGIVGTPCLDMATRPGNGSVEKITLNDAGEDYTNDTDVATTTTKGGSGLTVDIETNDDGAITTVSINKKGTGYSIGDVITIDAGDKEATVTVEEVHEAVQYDSETDITKVFVPYTPIKDKEAIMYLATPSSVANTSAALEADEGYYAPAEERTEDVTGYRYFEVKGNFKKYKDGIIVGYPLEFEVQLPRLYYRPNENRTDFTANLTVSRLKFSIGRSGSIQFNVLADGANQWKPVEHTSDSDRYAADTNPVKLGKDLYVVTLPLHQRNTNFELKLTSKFPYPVSLVSMSWEGHYSPRFYRRT